MLFKKCFHQSVTKNLLFCTLLSAIYLSVIKDNVLLLSYLCCDIDWHIFSLLISDTQWNTFEHLSIASLCILANFFTRSLFFTFSISTVVLLNCYLIIKAIKNKNQFFEANYMFDFNEITYKLHINYSLKKHKFKCGFRD